LHTFLQNFQEAAENENITVDNGSMRAVKSFLDSEGGKDFRSGINIDPDKKTGEIGRSSRRNRNLKEIVDSSQLQLSPEAGAAFASLKTSLADGVDPSTGSYTRQAKRAAGTAATPAPATAPTPVGGTGDLSDAVARGVREGARTGPAPVRIDTESGTIELHPPPARVIQTEPGDVIHESGTVIRPGATYTPSERTQSPQEQAIIRERTYTPPPPPQPPEDGGEDQTRRQ
jgi:hypothetical protein